MRALSIETTTHGRVLVRDAAGPLGLVVAFHGYGQSADEMLADVLATPGIDGWQVASVQALHRFYVRGDQSIVASWMTRQDREAAIADNVAYVDRLVRELGADHGRPLVFVGFSQGASMAYRAAMLGREEAAAVIALAGDVPPELKQGAAVRSWPRVLIGAGRRDKWFTPERAAEDAAFLVSAGARCDLVRFDAGHEWTDEFRASVGRLLGEVAAGRGARP
jgi:predicted esterase